MQIPIKHPGPCIAASAVLFAICALGLSKLTVSADARVFFSDRDPAFQSLSSFERRYSADTRLLIALHASDGSIFHPIRLNLIRQLTEKAWQLPYATKVESITNAIYVSSSGDTVVVDEAIPEVDLNNVQEAETRVMRDPLLVNRLISSDKNTTAIAVTFDYSSETSPVTNRIMDASRRAVSAILSDDSGLEVWYGGRVATSAAFSKSAKFDMALLCPIGYVLMFLLLATVLRSRGAAVALFSVGFLASIATLGLAGWLGIQISAATSTVPMIVIALAIATLMHLVLAIPKLLRDGSPQSHAISKALRNNIGPIATTLGTTVVGFLTLNWADAPPIRDLGNLVAIGGFLCFVFGYVWLPAILRYATFSKTKSPSQFYLLASRISLFVRHNHKLLLYLAPVVFGGLAVSVAKNRVDDDFNKYFDQRYELRRHGDLIEKYLTGLDIIEIDLAGTEPNAVFDPAYIEKLKRFETWLKDQPKVVFVSSVLEIFRRIHENVGGNAAEVRDIRTNTNTLAQYLLLYELSLPYGQNLNDVITVDRSRSRINVILRGAKSSDIVSFKENVEGWAASTYPSRVSATATGLSVMYAYVTGINVRSMIGGTFVALAVISFILFLTFRSFKYGAISLIPNLLPAMVAFGIWGIFIGEVGVAVSVVGVITLGIIVDDTVHLLWRYSEGRRRGLDADKSVAYVFDTVGEPMLVSSVALIIGFGVVSISGFLVSSAMGALSAVTIGIALLADWFLLAPLLMAIDN